MVDPAADRWWRLAHLPPLVCVSVVLAVVAAALGGLTRGGAGAAGAAVGVGIVTVSYLLSTLVLAWADSVNPQLVLPFGLALYAAKFTAIGVVMARVSASGWPGLPPLGLGVVAGVVAWTAAHVWWLGTVHAGRTRPRPSAATAGATVSAGAGDTPDSPRDTPDEVRDTPGGSAPR